MICLNIFGLNLLEENLGDTINNLANNTMAIVQRRIGGMAKDFGLSA